MNGSTRNIVIVVVIALLAFGVLLAVYNNNKSQPMDANTVNKNILDDANTGLDNLINNILDENIENNVENKENNDISNSQNTNTQSAPTQNQNKDQSNSIKEDLESQNASTPGEKKAVELAKEEWKKEWGSLDDVSFNNVMIQGDGKYVVSVNDSKTTRVIKSYVVDTITGIVEEQ